MAIDFGMVKIKVLSRYEPSKKMHPKAFIYITLNFPTTHPPMWSAYSTGENRHGKNYDAIWRLWWSSRCVIFDLCDLLDCSPPGSSVHGISQARILEWVAISFSRGSSWPRDQTCISCIAGGPHIAGGFFTTEPSGKPKTAIMYNT